MVRSDEPLQPAQNRAIDAEYLREQFGPEPDVDEVYSHVTRVMQEALDGLYAERRFPVIG